MREYDTAKASHVDYLHAYCGPRIKFLVWTYEL